MFRYDWSLAAIFSTNILLPKTTKFATIYILKCIRSIANWLAKFVIISSSTCTKHFSHHGDIIIFVFSINIFMFSQFFCIHTSWSNPFFRQHLFMEHLVLQLHTVKWIMDSGDRFKHLIFFKQPILIIWVWQLWWANVSRFSLYWCKVLWKLFLSMQQKWVEVYQKQLAFLKTSAIAGQLTCKHLQGHCFYSIRLK